MLGRPDPDVESMMPVDLVAAKAQLRQRLRARLQRVSPDEAAAAGRAIARHLAEAVWWIRAERVGIFVSLPDEIDTTPVMELAVRAGKQVLVPRRSATSSLEFVATSSPADFVRARDGLREPKDAAPIVGLDDRSVVFTPGIAFDRSGGRLGRGRGYYDRCLASARAMASPPLVMGVGFSFQLVEHVPMGPLDMRVDGVVTDRERLELEPLGDRVAVRKS